MPNSLIQNRNTENIFLQVDITKTGTFKNITGAALDLVPGQVLGRVGTGGDLGKIVALDPAATDGSQFPYGICMTTSDAIADDGEVAVTVLKAGIVDKELVVMLSGDAITNVVTLITVEDRLEAMGIYLKTVTQLSAYDNQ
jgi:hypothetical protein